MQPFTDSHQFKLTAVPKIQKPAAQELVQRIRVSEPLGKTIYDHLLMADPLDCGSSLTHQLTDDLHLDRRPAVICGPYGALHKMIEQRLGVDQAQPSLEGVTHFIM